MNKGPDRIWELLAKQMLGSATAEELEELQELLCWHPDQARSVRVVENFLNTQEEEDPEIDYTEQLEKIWEKVAESSPASDTPAPSLPSTQKT